MAISAFNIYLAGQNGNTEVTVVPDGMPASLPPAAFSALPREQVITPTLSPSSTEVPLPKPVVASPPRPATVTLDHLVKTFNRQAKHLAMATRQTMECHFKVAARHMNFERDVRDISLGDLRNLKSKLSEDHKPSSVNDIIFKGLGALFRLAIDDDLIERSPLERLKRSRKGEPDRKQPTWEQSQEIADAVAESSPETGIIVGFMRNFGVGQAEIKYLFGEHIDLRAGVIHFRRKKTGKPFDVPIFPHAKPFIESLNTTAPFQVGKPVVEWRNPRKALGSACERLSLPSFEPRALRRCFIVHCLQEGIDPRLVAKWQGHKDAKLIFSVYGKFIDHDYELAQAARLGGVTGETAAVGKVASV
jgi:integrase